MIILCGVALPAQEWLRFLGNQAYLQQLTDRTDIPQASAVIMQYTDIHRHLNMMLRLMYALAQMMELPHGEQCRTDCNVCLKWAYPQSFMYMMVLGHGFGLGHGTVADGWINDALKFWQRI